MKDEHRRIILAKCKNGEEITIPKTSPDCAPIKWNLGKLLAIGVTENGFPYIVWESTNFGSILVGVSRPYYYGLAEKVDEPKSRLRNDADCSSCLLCSFEDRQYTATKMSKEILY